MPHSFPASGSFPMITRHSNILYKSRFFFFLHLSIACLCQVWANPHWDVANDHKIMYSVPYFMSPHNHRLISTIKKSQPKFLSFKKTNPICLNLQGQTFLQGTISNTEWFHRHHKNSHQIYKLSDKLKEQKIITKIQSNNQRFLLPLSRNLQIYIQCKLLFTKTKQKTLFSSYTFILHFLKIKPYL